MDDVPGLGSASEGLVDRAGKIFGDLDIVLENRGTNTSTLQHFFVNEQVACVTTDLPALHIRCAVEFATPAKRHIVLAVDAGNSQIPNAQPAQLRIHRGKSIRAAIEID